MSGMLPSGGGLQVYRAISDTWEDPDNDPEYVAGLLGNESIERIMAEGGPYDGVELAVPPKGKQLLLPAAYADPTWVGKVIYERQGDRMVYVGQPDQTDAIAEEMASREPETHLELP